MRVVVVGLGYVGSVCSACLASRGHSVVGVDSSEYKVDLIARGQSPIVSAWVDPNAAVLLDDNLLDNAASDQTRLPLVPSERSLAALQWLGGLLAP